MKTNALLNSLFLNSPSFHFVNSLLFTFQIAKQNENKMLSWSIYFWILIFTSSIRFYSHFHIKTIWKQMLSWILYFWILILFTSSIRFYSPFHSKTIWKHMIYCISYFWIVFLFTSSIRCESLFHIKTIWNTSAFMNSLFLNSPSFHLVNSLLFTFQ